MAETCGCSGRGLRGRGAAGGPEWVSPCTGRSAVPRRRRSYALRALRRAAAPPSRGGRRTGRRSGRTRRIYGRGARTTRAAGGRPRNAQGVRREAACTVRAHRRGHGGDREQPRRVCRGEPGAVRLRRLRRVRYGESRVGEPTLTTALRGDVACIVTVRTLEHPLHSASSAGRPRTRWSRSLGCSRASRRRGQRGHRGRVSHGVGRSGLSAEDFRASAAMLDGVELTAPARSARGSGRNPRSRR